MRLWHKDLLLYLPSQQLTAQWRECCAIAYNLARNHTPNHILVNEILSYEPTHYISYCSLVFKEAYERGYRISDKARLKLEQDLKAWQLYLADEIPWELDSKIPVPYDELFAKWHNERYATQCYYNLEEKYDRGGIPEDEWAKVQTWWKGAHYIFPMNPPE